MNPELPNEPSSQPQSQQGQFSHRLSNEASRGHHESFRMGEDFFRQVIESLEDYAVFTTDTEGNISSWNPAAQRILGYGEREIIGQPAALIFTPEDRRQGVPAQELRTAAQRGQALDERFHLRKDGTLFWASGKVFPLYDQQQNLRGFTKILRDLSGPRQAQQGLFERILGQLPASIATLSGPQHRFSFFNPRYQGLVNHRAQLGETVADLLPEVIEQGFIGLLDKVYATGQPFLGVEMPIQLLDPDTGRFRQHYLDFIYQPLLDGQDRVTGILAFVVDATEKVRARQRVEESEAKLLAIIAAAPAGIGLFIGRDLIIENPNQTFIDIVGKGSDIVGKPLREVMPELLTENQPFLQILDEVYTSGKMFQSFGSQVMITQNGVLTDNYYNITYTPLFNGQGKVYAILDIAVDVTGEIRARQQLEKSRQQAQRLAEELQAANEEILSTNDELSLTNSNLVRTNVDLDNFIYTASHDLKAPISNIEGLITSLLRSLPPEVMALERVKRTTSLMQESVERFKKTIANLTEVVKLQKENGGEASLVDLPEMIREVVLDLEPLIAASGAKLTVAVADCPTIRFSEKNLRSVVYNLASNALKYRSPDRVPQLGIGCDSTPDYHVLRVTDNGLGMESGRLRQLFTMFKRFHTHVEGSGIGLYMIKRMVENAGGRIEVESQPGVGSTFRVYFKR